MHLLILGRFENKRNYFGHQNLAVFDLFAADLGGLRTFGQHGQHRFNPIKQSGVLVLMRHLQRLQKTLDQLL